MAVTRALLAVAFLAGLAGCGTKPCADGTAFVAIELGGNAATATELVISYAVDAATPKMVTRPREPGERTESFRIDFTDGYPGMGTLFVAVRAQAGGQVLGAAQQSVDLGATCTALTLTLGSGGLENGEPCSGGGCKSGFCVDGVCCDKPCDGQCEACDVSGSVGVCSLVTGAPHAGRPACAGTGACSAECDGTRRATCVFPEGRTCGPESCSNGAHAGEQTCSDEGPLTLERSETVDEEISTKVVDFLDRARRDVEAVPDLEVAGAAGQAVAEDEGAARNEGDDRQPDADVARERSHV